MDMLIRGDYRPLPLRGLQASEGGLQTSTERSVVPSEVCSHQLFSAKNGGPCWRSGQENALGDTAAVQKNFSQKLHITELNMYEN